MNTGAAIKAWVLGVAAFLTAGLAWSAAPLDNPLVGRWLVQRVGTRDATKLPIKIEWQFTKDEVIVRDLTNSQEVSRNKYKIDTTQNPKWITVTIVDQVTEIREGIFRIVGDESVRTFMRTLNTNAPSERRMCYGFNLDLVDRRVP